VGGSSNGKTSDEIDSAATIYNSRSKNFQISYIVLIGFSLFFLFLILFPYISLKYSMRDQASDTFLESLSSVVSISNEYSNISNTLISQIVQIRQSLNDEYDKLDKYFADVETMESLYRIRNVSSTLSLRIPSQLFMSCSQYPIASKAWGDCNADVIARDVAATAGLTLQPVIDDLRTATMDSGKVKKRLEQSIDYLLLNNTKVPSSIKEQDWIFLRNNLTSLKSRIANLQIKLDQDIEYVNSSGDNLWRFIGQGETFSPIATSEDLNLFSRYIDSLRDDKEQVGKEFMTISNRLQEIEAPYIGKVSLSLSNAVAIFPFAMAAGFLVCSYLAFQLIRARAVVHRMYEKVSPGKFERDIYPLWIEPLDAKMKYFQPIVFTSIPLIIFVLSSYLISSVADQMDDFPLFQFSPSFNQKILEISTILSAVLFLVAIWLIFSGLRQYSIIASPQ
jgi:hypothetical protein